MKKIFFIIAFLFYTIPTVYFTYKWGFNWVLVTYGSFFSIFSLIFLIQEILKSKNK